MNGHDSYKQKNKRPKRKTLITTRPNTPVNNTFNITVGSSFAIGHTTQEPQCTLLAAKDSEWVDIVQTPSNSKLDNNNDEAVECEEGPQMKPLMLMFPQLLEEDPEMVEGMLNKAMSTTEVTKHLVGQKANFAFMKKVNRLIPSDKKWLETVSEYNTPPCCSKESSFQSRYLLSDYEADTEETDEEK
ncbi:uncharacterized protein LOC116765304 isoform X2 [Danaus plexippus]|uniref:uncharacterized protein LOC116765304 isoform X2 n=1 Tax=Danaus plexippus TaxID=13037 RepID=UPI0013C428A6|nr:uncharacterized protein LOC116765304 isoform X2 [Danaus plexippus]